jgi:soluble lytic murein transglycosylase-like protein
MLCCCVLMAALFLGRAKPAALADRPPGPPAPTRATSVDSVFDAVSSCAARLSERERWHLADTVHRESRRHGYDPLFVLAMIQVESGCSTTARGYRGGVGLTQMTLSTGRAVARAAGVPWRGAETLTRPAANVQLGVRYLSDLEELFGDLHVAVAAYNLGPTRVRRMPRHRARQARYVRKVMARYEGLTSVTPAARS